MAHSIADDVIEQCAQDLRRTFDPVDDSNILLDYLDRAHKELLRFSRWAFLISPVYSFTTQLGKEDYYIGNGTAPVGSVDTGLDLDVSTIKTIKLGSTFDRSNRRHLTPTAERPLAQQWEQNGRPRLYRWDPTSPEIISLYQAPDADGYVIEFRTYAAPVKVGPGVTLQTPSEYDDVLIARVNAYGYQLLKNDPNEAANWMALFREGLRSMFRDKNLFPRGPEFIRPDPMSQLNFAVATGTFDDLFQNY